MVETDLPPGGAVKLTWELKVTIDLDVEPILAQLSDHMDAQQRAAFRDKLERYAHKPDRDLILAIHGGQVLGLICVIDQAEFPSSLPKKALERLRNFACSTQLLVHPQVRKQGIGASLQLRAEQWARERGRAGLWLVTHRMAYWYRNHFGYEEVGRVNVKNTEKSVMAREFPLSRPPSKPRDRLSAPKHPGQRKFVFNTPDLIDPEKIEGEQ